MSNYNHTPNNKQSPKQANNAQSDSKLIRLKTNLSFISLIDWTAILLFIVLCISHCTPAYAEIKNETLVSVKAIVNQAIAENETLMKQLNETVSFKNHLTNGNVGGYYKALSQSKSVTPQRYRGFFVPKVYIDSQPIKRLSTTQFINILSQGKPNTKELTLIGLSSFHVLVSPQNKHFLNVNMWGGSFTPRECQRMNLFTGLCSNLKSKGVI